MVDKKRPEESPENDKGASEKKESSAWDDTRKVIEFIRRLIRGDGKWGARLHGGIQIARGVMITTEGFVLTDKGVEKAGNGFEMADEGLDIGDQQKVSNGANMAGDGLRTAAKGLDALGKGVTTIGLGVQKYFSHDEVQNDVRKETGTGE